MQTFSVSVSLSGRKIIIVGISSQALAIAAELGREHAKVTLVGDIPSDALPDGISYHQPAFAETDLNDCWLVVAASDSASDNVLIKSQCDARQIFCYLPDDPASGTWQPELPFHPSMALSTITMEKHAPEKSEGLVSLVGAGPGHPDLLTVRALKLIKNADAIVYDRLVSDAIMALCNSDAKFVYAGKAKANHTLPQQSINALLVDLAQEYKNVVRLKGGDPFIFGRGGEEIETLAEHNIQFQIVPGITAASGCAAFAGIPLTHRDHAQSCIFITGHLRDGKINLNWQELKDPGQTIVVYMGLTGVDVICSTLIQYGRTADTPAALVERGTKPEQRVLSATLETLPALIADSKVVAPTLLIIGGVVSLRNKLQWF